METIDYTDWIANKGHVPRNLLLYVVHTPADMRPELADALKHVFQTRVSNITGFMTGYDIGTVSDTGLIAMSPVTPTPRVYVHEVFGRPIAAILTEWMTDHVVGKNTGELTEDGVKLLFVEPDVTGQVVMDAWLIEGAYLNNTGSTDAQRDLPATRDPVIYEIEVEGDILYRTPEVLELAQATLTMAFEANPDLYADANPTNIDVGPGIL